jgi:MFS family permease
MTFAPYRQIFQNRSFRLFWLGFAFSYLGDALTHVAFTWFVYQLTHSAQALGWLMLCYTGPVVMGGLLAGSLLDRFDRRKVMIVDSVIRGTTIALIPLLYWLGQLQIWQIYAAAAVYGLLMMIVLAGGPALIPMLVQPDELSTANALEMLGFNIGGVLGPVLAGLLISRIGAPNVIVLDVISYFTFALLLSQIHLPVGTPYLQGSDKPASHHSPPTYHLSHAFRLILNQPILRTITLMFLVYNIGSGIIAVWLPILVDRTLGGGAQLYGTLLGLQALAEVISALVVGGADLPFSLGTRICLSQALAGVVLLPLIALPNFWLVAIGFLGYGLFSTPLTIWAQTLRMQIIPEQLRGRTFALLRMLMRSGDPIGGGLGGLLLPLLGLPLMIAGSALLIGLPGLVGLGSKALRLAGVKPCPAPEAEPIFVSTREKG